MKDNTQMENLLNEIIKQLNEENIYTITDLINKYSDGEQTLLFRGLYNVYRFDFEIPADELPKATRFLVSKLPPMKGFETTNKLSESITNGLDMYYKSNTQPKFESSLYPLYEEHTMKQLLRLLLAFVNTMRNDEYSVEKIKEIKEELLYYNQFYFGGLLLQWENDKDELIGLSKVLEEGIKEYGYEEVSKELYIENYVRFKHILNQK